MRRISTKSIRTGSLNLTYQVRAVSVVVALPARSTLLTVGGVLSGGGTYTEDLEGLGVGVVGGGGADGGGGHLVGVDLVIAIVWHPHGGAVRPEAVRGGPEGGGAAC